MCKEIMCEDCVKKVVCAVCKKKLCYMVEEVCVIRGRYVFQEEDICVNCFNPFARVKRREDEKV